MSKYDAILSNVLEVKFDEERQALTIYHPARKLSADIVISKDTLLQMSLAQAAQFVGERVFLKMPSMRDVFEDYLWTKDGTVAPIKTIGQFADTPSGEMHADFTENYVSSTRMRGIASSGREFDIIVSVGKPFKDTEAKSWKCSVKIDPLYKRIADARGSDSFHALRLATELIVTLLGDFVEKGGRLQCEDGTEFMLSAYSFNGG